MSKPPSQKKRLKPRRPGAGAGVRTVALYVSLAAAGAISAPTPKDLDASFTAGQWDESVEIAHEILLKNPNYSLAKLRAAYALFQRGFSNAALKYLKEISPTEWKTLPQGEDRLVEIVSLFQKKVPLNALPGRLDQLDENHAAHSLRDEILYSKGRRYFELRDSAKARMYLESISKGSRFYGEARYLLGALAARTGDYKTSAAEFSRIFEPSVFEQSAEFWKDMTTQLSEHWGGSLKILMDAGALQKSNLVAELSLIGLARVAYGGKDFETALQRYSKIPRDSRYYSEAALERVWTLLALDRHDDAQKAAAELALVESSFQALQARPLRALILADSGRVAEARDEIGRFQKIYDDTRTELIKFQQYPTGTRPPSFLKVELEADDQLQRLVQYQAALKNEADALRAENLRLFPVYLNIANSLEPLILEARGGVARIVQDHIDRRLAELEKMYVQSKLIAAETYLEERERLRTEFQKTEHPDAADQKRHDVRLVELLTLAVREVDEASLKIKHRHLNLEFRQSELLWELSKARMILGLSNQDKKELAAGEALRLRALRAAEDIARNFPDFQKRAQAMFFTGFAYMELGRVADGIEMLLKFLREFPKHAHAPDANRILADIKFEENKFAEAQSFYTRILEFPDSPIIGYALYKIGWCAYNQKNYGKAMLGLEQAVLWSNEHEKNQNLLSLKREARHDLIAIYAEVGDHKKALSYFQNFLGGESLTLLTELADELEKNGQYEKSSDLYKQLTSADPTAGENLSYQASIVKGEYKLHRWNNVLKASKHLADRYGTRLTTAQPAGTPEFLAEQLLREVVLAQHFEFSKSEQADDLARILELDNIYLSLFDNWPTSQDPLFHHAYFLAKHGKQEEAVDAYRKHWTKFRDVLKEPTREEALRNLLHSLEVVEKKEKGAKGAPSKFAAEILQFSDDYLKAYPKSAQARPIALLRSAILFKYEMDDSGIEESQKLLANNPGDDTGKLAFNNLRVAFYKSKDWKKTYEWASSMGNVDNDPRLRAFASELKSIKEESLFLWAENTKEDLAAAELFMKVAEDPQMMRLHEKGLYNAFIRYQRAGKKMEALDAADRLEKLFPKFEHLPEIAGIRAVLYQEAGDYERALPHLALFVKSVPRDVTPAVLQQARLNAGLIAEALGKNGQALDYFGEFLKTADKSTPGFESAKRALNRAKSKSERAMASESASWNAMLREKAEFERLPLVKSNDLATRIKGGGLKLEKVAKHFLDLSAKGDSPSDLGYEAYCAVPFLYAAYAKAVAGLGQGVPRDVKVELDRIVEPINAKAEEIALECVTRSSEAEHDGPMYRRVMGRWGWQSKAVVRERVNRLIETLAMHYPWLEPSPLALSEKEILEMNLKGQGNEDTWYALARSRAAHGKIALARLTLEDALSKNPGSGRLLNTMAYLTQSGDDKARVAGVYEKAAANGSSLAWANLALYHLKGARLPAAHAALKAAAEAKLFDSTEDLKKLVELELK